MRSTGEKYICFQIENLVKKSSLFRQKNSSWFLYVFNKPTDNKFYVWNESNTIYFKWIKHTIYLNWKPFGFKRKAFLCFFPNLCHVSLCYIRSSDEISTNWNLNDAYWIQVTNKNKIKISREIFGHRCFSWTLSIAIRTPSRTSRELLCWWNAPNCSYMHPKSLGAATLDASHFKGTINFAKLPHEIKLHNTQMNSHSRGYTKRTRHYTLHCYGRISFLFKFGWRIKSCGCLISM